MRTIIHNACILPMNHSMEVISNGSILVEGEQIKQIQAGKIEETGATYFDAEGMVVMPGFVNTHTHVPMTLLRGYADDLPLHTWLTEHIFPAEAKLMTPEHIRIGTRLALIEMIKSGTTCFNDMYFFEEQIAAEASQVGIRAVVGESVIDFPTPSFKTPEEGFERSEQLLQQWQASRLIHPIVCAHSPYTCSTKTLMNAKAMANKYNTSLHIHVAETRKEVEGLSRQQGMTPVQYLHAIGVLDHHTIAAHGVWFNDQDIELFAVSGASIAHCPKSNLKLASGIANTARYQAARINVSIGTDGAASNNTLDMVEEMRFAALLPKGSYYNPEAIPAREVLRMATINGAKTLGIETLTGSIEVGKRADMIFVHTDASNIIPVHDIYSALVYAMNSKNIRHSMVNGQWIMKNRTVLHIDKEETMEEIQRIALNHQKK